MNDADGGDIQEIESDADRPGQRAETEEPRKGTRSLDGIYCGDTGQPGDGVGNGGVAERNRVASARSYRLRPRLGCRRT